MSRALKVQTPGGTPNQDDPQTGGAPVADPNASVGANGGVTGDAAPASTDAGAAARDAEIAALRAQLAAREAEVKKLKAKPAPAPEEKFGKAAEFSKTHSSEVDVAKLTAPVLCSDGWLVPLPKADERGRL